VIAPPNTIRCLRPAAVANKLGIALSSLWIKVKQEPDFPRPFKLGPRTTAFLEHELDQYLAGRATLAQVGKEERK
jgi:predicted DNA-binding transcriptional regulator AlpA